LKIKLSTFILLVVISAIFTIFINIVSNNSNQKVNLGAMNVIPLPVLKKQKVSYNIKTIATIGVEEAETPEMEPYQIASIRNVDCDSKGNLYVVESKTDCVKVFDQNGDFLRKMFRFGKGPREINHPAKLKFNRFSKTLFLANENGYSMKQFTLDGKFLKSILLPDPIHISYDFISPNELIYISESRYGSKDYYNFKVLDLQSGKINSHIVSFNLSDRPTAYNGLQRFVVKDDLLWTCTIDKPYLLAYDLSTRKQVKQLIIKDDYKENTITTGHSNGMTWEAVVGYNYIHPLLLNGELFAIWVSKNYRKKQSVNSKYNHDRIRYPEIWKSELYRIKNDESVEKIANLEDCDHMRMETTYKNRIIFSGYEPYLNIKIVEVSVN